MNNVPRQEEVPFNAFVDKVLKPVVNVVQARKLGGHIDYIVYSSDFPTAITIGPQMKKFLEMVRNVPGFPKSLATRNAFQPKASINALTYFAMRTLSNNPTFMGLESNKYMRTRNLLILSKPFIGDTQKEFEEALRLAEKTEYDTALEILNKLSRKHPRQVATAYWLARIHAQNGNAKEANSWLRRSLNLGWAFREYTKKDTAFASLIGDPGFSEVLREMPDEDFRFLPTHGFRSFYHWGNNGMINNSTNQGESYLLSTVLAVTRNQGTSEKDALEQIKRSVAADGTQPKGTFYFCITKDVRVRARQNGFASTVNELRKLGHKTEAIAAKEPGKKTDILGLVLGSARFKIPDEAKIIPGAICENLTSFGGVMAPGKGQTKLSELIKNGAAGSSGTVVEPLALAQKFPQSRIHYHYARGCSLAESFYQSVHGPYQLLIVGDALCQPFATMPEFELKGVSSGQKMKGNVQIKLDFSKSPVSLGGVEIYMDGMLLQRMGVVKQFSFDTTAMPDGFHELRVVATAANQIETTGRVVIPFWVNNNERKIKVSPATKTPSYNGEFKVDVVSNFGDSITLLKGLKKLGEKQGNKVKFTVNAKDLGRGPVELIAVVKDGEQVVSSRPVQIDVKGNISMKIRQYGTPDNPKKKSGKKTGKKTAPPKSGRSVGK